MKDPSRFQGRLTSIRFQRFKVGMSKPPICRLLTQLGSSPQRPVWRAYQQRPEGAQKWLQAEYPRIRRLAQQRKALIFFGNAAGFGSDHHAGTTWAVKGKTPVVSSTEARFSLNLISAVSGQGEFRFMSVTGRVGTTQLIEFAKRLLNSVLRMVFVIVGGHPAHQAKSVKRFTESEESFSTFLLSSLFAGTEAG